MDNDLRDSQLSVRQVDRIADNRQPQFPEVDADLVRATGQRTASTSAVAITARRSGSLSRTST